jgi:23S rRNA (uracil1939-C5)-methyltransferase
MIVKIEKLDHNGRGITHIANKVTFIENALPNEIIDIKLTKEKKKYNEGTMVKIIEKNPNRIEPKCPYYTKCGGCEIMHMNYSSQLEYKKEKVKNILKKYANIDITPNIVASSKELSYRNKITLHEKNGKIGYMKKTTNEIIEIDSCPLAMEKINEYLRAKKDKIKNEFIIKTNENGEIISSIENEKLIIKINDLKFNIDINSFFQINNYICSELFKHIENNLDKCKTCLDLYSGVGTLSIVASKKANFVYSIEVNPYSHKNALKNQELNNAKNIKFILGKVEDEINKIDEEIDVIITDPPRSGMDKKTIEIINKIKPQKLIYISCDPMTLARDLNNLKEKYVIKNMTLFDMFPNTKHVECVCVMSRR